MWERLRNFILSPVTIGQNSIEPPPSKEAALRQPAPGVCPSDYYYGPESLNGPPALESETLYVVGGLYGNPEALDTLLAMKTREEKSGGPVTLVFNGDFNWFNVDPAGFRRINEAVLGASGAGHLAILGNVEAELAREGPGRDCGCNYPPHTGPDIVERSNRIFSRLRETSLEFPALREALGALPRHLTVGVGPARIGILHGDPEQLAGWSLSAESLPEGDSPPLPGSRPDSLHTPSQRIADYFRASGLDAFATSHTCLGFAMDLKVEGRTRIIINNGSAGMPNFADHPVGMLTRISSKPEAPAGSLYGLHAGGVRYDALPIPYDQRKWLARFGSNWPAGSPAHLSYHGRLTSGPPYRLSQAVRGRFRGEPLSRTA